MATYDEATARALLTRTLGGDPTLAGSDLDLLVQIAGSLAADNVTTVYTSADLNRAAATGCRWKSALTSDQYDVGGGSEAGLTRSQWWEHWTSLATAYESGQAGVDGIGTGRGRGGIVSIPVVGSTVTP